MVEQYTVLIIHTMYTTVHSPETVDLRGEQYTREMHTTVHSQKTQ